MEIKPSQSYTSKVNYGEVESKKAINSVLNLVLNQYKFSSIPELNAVLKQYNIMADRGKENSRIFQTKGLVYRLQDEKGNPIGVPIKVSDFYSKPTLKFLEEKFKSNETKKTSDKIRVKNAIDLPFLKEAAMSLTKLERQLKKEGIDTVFRKSTEGLLYGITYIDHTTKKAFNGSSLGKQYSAKAIEKLCRLKIAGEEKRNQIYERLPSKESLIDDLRSQKNILTIADLVKRLDMLL